MHQLKESIRRWLETGLRSLCQDQAWAWLERPIEVERCRQAQHGHFASNVAMMWAKAWKMPPRALAEALLERLEDLPWLASVEIAGPGFINMRVTHEAIWKITRQPTTPPVENGQMVFLEYVSANPTGPLHVGHGRGAVVGSVLDRVFKRVGYQVQSDYYVNDAGRQMRLLTLSVWLRYVMINMPFYMPPGLYQGDYVVTLADEIYASHGLDWMPDASWLLPGVNDVDDRALDALVEDMHTQLGAERVEAIHSAALKSVLSGIQSDLAAIGVEFTHWFSESSLLAGPDFADVLRRLRACDGVYKAHGALWFKASAFGDEKDRVLVRANGEPTYFATDIAYHWHKWQSGADRIVTIMGSDHHGYIPRLMGAMEALGCQRERFEFLLVQFVTLVRGGEKVPMSTRSGQFVTLADLKGEVGKAALRFFYARAKSDQHMDFDLSLAVSHSQDNPIYYIQYAHARICRVLEQAGTRPMDAQGESDALTQEILLKLWDYDDVVEHVAHALSVHELGLYLMELARLLHVYYNDRSFLQAEGEARASRLVLIGAIQSVLADGMGLLGIEPVERM